MLRFYEIHEKIMQLTGKWFLDQNQSGKKAANKQVVASLLIILKCITGIGNQANNKHFHKPVNQFEVIQHINI